MCAQKPRRVRARLVGASKRAQSDDACRRPLLGQRPAGEATLLGVDGRERAIGMAIAKVGERAPQSASLLVERPIRQGGGSMGGVDPAAISLGARAVDTGRAEARDSKAGAAAAGVSSETGGESRVGSTPGPTGGRSETAGAGAPMTGAVACPEGRAAPLAILVLWMETAAYPPAPTAPTRATATTTLAARPSAKVLPAPVAVAAAVPDTVERTATPAPTRASTTPRSRERSLDVGPSPSRASPMRSLACGSSSLITSSISPVMSRERQIERLAGKAEP